MEGGGDIVEGKWGKRGKVRAVKRDWGQKGEKGEYIVEGKVEGEMKKKKPEE